jgi:aryl-alcohol dehydrogenase-like predicted oxidoreductase
MKSRPFGRTDLRVSELCLGTMHFGWKTDERTSGAILDTFHSAGGNFVQAASGTPVGCPIDLLAGANAEKHVGKWMASRRVPRDSMVIATRLVVRNEPLSDRALASCVRRNCETSLRRLRTDYLDLLLCEWNHALLPMERLLVALAPLVRDGLVRYTGGSSFPAWRVVDGLAASRREPLPRFEAVQADLSLVARRSFDTEFAELCTEKGIAFLARSPLAGGFLVDGPPRWRAWTSVGREMWLRDRFSNHRSLCVRDVLEAIALGRGASVAQTALAWVLTRPAVTSAVIGVTSTEQLTNLIVATNASLTAREVALLERPGAVAPSALLGTVEPVTRPTQTIELTWTPTTVDSAGARARAGAIRRN